MFCFPSFSLQSIIPFLHSFLSRASMLSLHKETSLMWKGRGITYGTSADKSFEVHPSERAAREPYALSVFWGTDHTQSKLVWSPVTLLCCVSAANPQGTLEKVEVATSQPRPHSPGVLISLLSGRALSGPESSYCTGKWLQHVPFPLEIYLQCVWFQKEGGTPKTSKHFVPMCKKATRKIAMKSLPDGKALSQESKKSQATWEKTFPYVMLL